MKTIDMSGMGGGYEQVCQQMLSNGLRYLEQHPEVKGNLREAYRTYANVYGICTPETEAAEKFDEAIMEGIDDATGAMHHCVVGHLLYIAENGVDKWIKVASEGNPDRVFEWDGTVSSIPKVDLREAMI